MKKIMVVSILTSVLAFAGGKALLEEISADPQKSFYVEGVLGEKEVRDRLKKMGFDVDASLPDGPTLSLGIHFGYQVNDNLAIETRVYTGLRSDIDYYGYGVVGKLFLTNDTNFMPYIGAGYGMTHYNGYKEPKYANKWDHDKIYSPILLAGVRYKISEKYFVGMEAETHTKMTDSRASIFFGIKF